MIVRIQYDRSVRMPDSITIYLGDSFADTLHFFDRGQIPDSVGRDNRFAAYVREDIPQFVAKMQDLQNTISAQGGLLHFTGHLGHFVESAPFDFAAFTTGIEVLFPLLCVDASKCDDNLKKEKSLFITDLAVVEDELRTYNVLTDWGNDVGVWTFGNLIKNIANEVGPGGTGVSAKVLLKEWVSGWTDGRTVAFQLGASQSVPARIDALKYLIGPWLAKAISSTNSAHTLKNILYAGVSNTTDPHFWKTVWDQTDEDKLLKNAPFKLTAIVNRLDLLGNGAYGSGMSRFGETRFIYSLIYPLYVDKDGNGITYAGMPPNGQPGLRLNNQAFHNENPLDWTGMNVILEFGNPVEGKCEIIDLANQWAYLSDESLTQEQYNQALEKLTHFVIDANSAPGRPN